MNTRVRLACEPTVVLVPLERILPTRSVVATTKKSPKYLCIEASLKELGLIEPLVVFPQRKGSTHYMLLDGHTRFQILKDHGQIAARCLVATDDEAFTYNHKVNRLSPIQEHFMIKRAIKNGVSEARIARTLNIELSTINEKRDLLDGICPEAVELLRDRRAGAGTLREFRKVRPMRQIEMAELLCASNNFSAGYAKCLIAATPRDQLIEPDRPKDSRGLSAEDVARMEREMENLGKDFKVIEESHGRNTLNLVVVNGYLKRLVENTRVNRFLTQKYPELLTELHKIVEARILADPATDGT